MAKIIRKDGTERAEVEVDHKICIACGRCISACKHGARYFNDDTERPYKKAFAYNDGCKIFEDGAGKQFDQTFIDGYKL